MDQILHAHGFVLDESSRVWRTPGFSGTTYNDGDEAEERIERIISRAFDRSVLSAELRRHCLDWVSTYHLSAQRANLLRPFEGLLRGNVLEIGSGCGAISRYLGECGGQVMSVEPSLRRARISRLRTADLPNVTVVASQLEELELDIGFDVVVLVGVLEYAGVYADGPAPALHALRRVRALLKPDGHAIIAIENQLGLKYFAGAPEDHLGEPMYGLEGRYRAGEPRTFGRRELDTTFARAGFGRRSFYAPFPDYKFPSSIVSEAGFRHEGFDAAAFAWQSVKRDPQLPEALAFSPELVWPTVFENGLGIDLSNAFLVLASPGAHQSPAEALAYHYSTDRMPPYCKETRFVVDGSGDVRVMVRRIGASHPESRGAPVAFVTPEAAPYSRGQPMSLEFIRIVSRDGWDVHELGEFFRRHFNAVVDICRKRGLEVDGSLPSDVMLPGMALDAVPQNVMVTVDGSHELIDAEWVSHEKIPYPRLAFRSLLWLSGMVSRFGVPRTKVATTNRGLLRLLFEDLGIPFDVGVLDGHIESEARVQEHVTGRPAQEFIQRWLDAPIRTSSALGAGGGRRSTDLEHEMSLLREEINAFRGSVSWRITAPMRWAGRRVRRLRDIGLRFVSFAAGFGGNGNLLRKVARVARAEGVRGVWRRVRAADLRSRLLGYGVAEDYSRWLKQFDTLTDSERERIRVAGRQLRVRPRFSVIMPVFNPPLALLERAVESVRAQLYDDWELCIADDASTDTAVVGYLTQLAEADPRVKLKLRDVNGHISRASNSALELASGDFVVLMDQDDLLAEHALYHVAKVVSQRPDVGLVYTDEDKVTEAGWRFGPYFKPDFNYELLLAQNTMCHLTVIRRDLVTTVGGFRTGFEGAQDHDLLLRVVELLHADQIVHVPKVLYHWRATAGSTALDGGAKPYALEAAQRAVAEHLQRRDVIGDVVVAPESPAHLRVRFAIRDPRPTVSIIIPTRDRVELLRPCVESIRQQTSYEAYEIVIVDNGSTCSDTLRFLDSVDGAVARVIRDASEFNFSALVNLGVKNSAGEMVCLLNNDMEIINPDWLHEMVSFAQMEDIGCVGARLWYPNGQLQHGGVILGLGGRGGVAGHAHKNLRKGAAGHGCRAVLHQSVSAVTAACLMVRRQVFEQVGGFDPDLAVAFNDVDFCLRVREAGYRNVWTPYAELIHHESASRGHDTDASRVERFGREIALMRRRWGRDLDADPAYNPNLTLDREDFSLAWPPRVGGVEVESG